MSDTPDFDSMSPEEMMRWMESLAKRQGADTEGFTTEADLEVDEVDEADERLSGQGEYIPHGWTKEKWEAQLAKEAEEKAQKQAAQQQAESAADEPTPQEPAAETAQPSMEDADFENMSPEEAMNFMESLAKRQGATEGFTTSADMEVDEVDEADERLAGQGEYIPHGMSEEEWEKRKAQEEADKQRRLAEQQAAQQQESAADEPAAEETASQPESEPVPDEPAAQAEQPSMEDADFENMSPEEAMRFMESLAKRQGATEGFTTSADMEVDEVDESDERLKDQPEYIPDGWSKERWEAQLEKERAEREARQAQQQAAETDEPDDEDELVAADLDDIFGGDNELPPMEDDAGAEDEEDELVAADFDDIFGGDNEIPSDDEDKGEAVAAADLDDIFGGDNELPPMEDDAGERFTEEETRPAQPVSEQQNPMDWLSGLAGEEEEKPDDLDMDALGELEGLAGGDEGDDPMDWLAGLADDDEQEDMPDMDSLEGLEGLEGLAAEDDEQPAASAEPADDESLEWMESLARRQGADSEELVTGGEMELPDAEDDTTDESPGYEPYSFESGTGTGMDAEDAELEDEFEPPVANFDTGQLELEDPASWLDSLASGVASSGDDDDTPEEEPDAIHEPVAEDDPGYEEDEDEEVTSDVTSKLNTGEDVSPEEIQSFFEAQFRRADKRDVPDYIDEDEFDEMPDTVDEDEIVEADIPDWLAESMGDEPPIADADDLEDEDDEISKTETAEMMVADLGLDEMDDEDDEFPDWLSGGADGDTGDISDIFADADDEMTAASADADEDLSFLDDVDETGEPAAQAAPDTGDEDDIKIDSTDTWVAAFSDEGADELEAWYESASAELEGEDVPETSEPAASTSGAALQAADLPVEADLPKGQPQPMPDWMGSAEADETPEAHPSMETEAVGGDDLAWLDDEDTDATANLADEDMPAWLQDQVDDTVADAEDVPEWLADDDLDVTAEDIPAWLRETMDEEQDAIPMDLEAEAALPEPDDEAALPAPDEPAEPAAQPPAPQRDGTAIQPAAKSPAPVPAAADDVDAAAVLQSARESVNQENTDDALADYELLIRANLVLDQVEDDIQKLTGKHKRNPAIHRLLGDVLMRQGKLQEALDTYRRALNML